VVIIFVGNLKKYIHQSRHDQVTSFVGMK